jgi:hypothetical protein
VGKGSGIRVRGPHSRLSACSSLHLGCSGHPSVTVQPDSFVQPKLSEQLLWPDTRSIVVPSIHPFHIPHSLEG